ncbi:hepatic lectin-like isoform X3 [Myxocyprinus asiaticus]|uniref:hepatic lectin-like isoform X3 n=1 Tax=Myxocyprinus asiaticus TaxID=70543 RepID=UPI002221EF91|nr:hepatic lectin-like isoform X3 [Myxocyprinus asiaticus]
MDMIYENSSYINMTRTASGDKCSHYKCQKTFNQERKKEVPLPKWTKVLLIVLSVSVVCALGGVCALGMCLSHAKHFSRSVSDQYHNDTESTGCALCAVHWIHSGGKCYYFSTVKMNWTQSRDYCVTLGGHLVIINSKAVQDFLVSEVKETHWIGLNDLETEGHWVWVNKQPLNDSIEFWMKRENGDNEPDNWTKHHPAGEDCASLGHSNGDTDFWNDAFCFEEKRFVCEAPASV